MRSLAVLVVALSCGVGCGSSAAVQGPGQARTDASPESDSANAVDATDINAGEDATSGDSSSGDAAAERSSDAGDASSAGGEGGPSDGASADAMPGFSDAASDASGSCPATQPQNGAACSGGATCQYGHSTCCGIAYSAFTCTCQSNGYSCAQTVECNFVCPDR
jgi:hypothetical protein